jgi:Lon protease-like protein
MSQEPFTLDDFAGRVRLFPLPNLVLFPHVAQPLHIFERRYRQLMADALDDDRLIAMALLRPGWEKDYHKNPPVHPVVCIGRIHHEERLSDGRYNLLLQGISRARLIEEPESDRLYRIGVVELMPDVPPAEAQEQPLRQELSSGVSPFFAAHPAALEQFQGLVAGPLSLGGLCDIVGFALPLDMERKQELLGEPCVEARVRLLLKQLESRTPPDASRRAFPPGFSDN